MLFTFTVDNKRHKLSTVAEICFKLSLGRSHPEVIIVWYYPFLMFLKAIFNNNMDITEHFSQLRTKSEISGSDVFRNKKKI